MSDQQDQPSASSPSPSFVTEAPSPQELEVGARFLLADYDLLRDFVDQDTTIATKRIDVLLTLTTALAAGMVLLSQAHINSQTFLSIALVGSLGLLGIGWTTFLLAIKRDISVVKYLRAINRIRAYFAEQAPHIKPFLLITRSHEYPRFTGRLVSGYALIVVAINSLLVGVSGTIIAVLVQQASSPNFVSVLIGGILTLTAYEAQRRYARRLYHREETKAQKLKPGEDLFS